MEGDALLSSMDSLWFYSSVFLRPSSSSSKHKESERAAEPPPPRDSASETNKTGSGGRPCQPPLRANEAAAAAAQTGRRAEAGMVRIAGVRRWEWDERMVAWHKEQRRRARVAAAARALCSQSQATMPPPGEGVAMKAHLRSWAHAVACSVR